MLSMPRSFDKLSALPVADCRPVVILSGARDRIRSIADAIVQGGSPREARPVATPTGFAGGFLAALGMTKNESQSTQDDGDTNKRTHPGRLYECHRETQSFPVRLPV
jgi:hypothetical protein